LREEITVEVESITKVEQEKKEGISESYRASLKELVKEGNPRSVGISSPNGFDFDVGEVLSVVISTSQKKLSDFKKKEDKTD
jgi:hypothetical protein